MLCCENITGIGDPADSSDDIIPVSISALFPSLFPPPPPPPLPSLCLPIDVKSAVNYRIVEAEIRVGRVEDLQWLLCCLDRS